MLHTDTNDLLKRAQIDIDVESSFTDIKRGSRAFGIREHGDNMNKGKRSSVVAHGRTKRKALRNSKTGAPAIQLEDSLQEVIDVILEEGYYDKVEGGVKSMKFGVLFDKFITMSGILVGLLMKGKKGGQLKYKGDMLFKGIHDEIKITVLN